jgi:TPP-dependent pyruvate/acetoin dehydrogenase alpha subunit
MSVQIHQLYEQLYLIRRFEETVLDLYYGGGLSGTTHTYIGQEANAVGIIDHLDPTVDNVLSSHRNHGHYLAFSDDVDGLLCEIMGKADGVCGGKGGSQHIHNGRFISNGIQGGIAPIAAGMALAEKTLGTQAVTVVFLGDGTLGQGVVYETLNMAALWSLPILFVVENNRYAQTTPVEEGVAGCMNQRAEAFGIANERLDSTNVLDIHELAGKAINSVRNTGKPFWLVLDTYRLVPHSKGDDFRSESEIESYRQYDPLRIIRSHMESGSYDAITQRVDARIAKALTNATNALVPEIPVSWLGSSSGTYGNIAGGANKL